MAESLTSGRYLAPALVACAAVTGSHAAELTIDRLFDAPSLAGPSIVGLKISPDGSRVTYLQGKPEDKDRLDLWEYSIAERRARLLVDSKVLAPADEKLSDEELGRRERQRTASLVRHFGILLRPIGACVVVSAWTGASTTTISRSRPRMPWCRSRTPQALRRMPPSRRAAATSRTCAIRISTPMTSPRAPKKP